MVRLLGGAVWRFCPLTEIGQYEDLEDVAAALWWLPSDKAQQLLHQLLDENRQLPVLAGYAGTRTGLREAPPEDAEEIDRSVFGHPILLAPSAEEDDMYPDLRGEVWEPYYIDVAD